MPTIRGRMGTANNGTTPIPVNVPTDSSAPVAGDYMIVVINTTAGSGVTITPPSEGSWVQILAPTASGTRQKAVYRGIRGSSDGSTYNFTQSTTGAVQALIVYGAGLYGFAGTFLKPSVSTNVQTTPGVTTVKANSLALSLQSEATAAVETDANITVASPFVKDLWTIASASPINSILLSHREMATAGATGDAVSTWLKSDGTANNTSNRGSIMVVIEPLADVTPQPVTQLAGQVADGNGGLIPVGLVAWANNDQGTPAEIALDKIEYVHSGTPIPDLQKLTRVWTMGHRGGSADYQEHSLRGYFECAINHIDVMEVSVAITSDGYFICAHDGTADRTSSAVAGQNWRFDQHTLAEVRALTQDLPNRGDTRFTTAPYMTLQEVFDKFGATHSFMIDPKEVSTANRPALYALIQTLPNYQIKVMGKFYSTGTAIADEFHAIGCLTWGYSYTADLGALEPLSSSPDGTEAGRRFIVRTDASSTKATEPKWDVLGLEHGADARAWAAMLVIAGNKKVVAHIVTTLAQADAAVAKGAKALQVAGIRSVMAGY